ncbi:P-loop containing nucleoside triphosphate hydrolase protein, partial [Mycena alexandri]
LPPEPKIFNGRESELSAIIKSFSREVPRIAILGAGGMGKTSLARAVLHHPEVASRYDGYRFFVPCDTVSSSIQLARLIGAHVGLESVNDLTGPVIRHFSSGPPTLLILDNLETVWEPTESRADVEKLLCCLTDVEHLAFIITMRGAERPANVQWTRPFLAPLKPLGHNAAHQTFIDIVDDTHKTQDIDTLLLLTDNMPLAIDLIANLVNSEGIPCVLSRWETQRTSILSEGHDTRSNLELSISLSLSGLRMISSPAALDLLSLLSLLPEGLSDVELLQSQFPVENIRACKSTLLRTSLAYTDGEKRLKVLVPVREYVHKNHPPHKNLIQPLSKHYQELLELYRKYSGTISNAGVTGSIACNFANIQNVLLHSL